MSSTTKLTKKQKKALAFRSRKGKPSKSSDDLLDTEDNAIPISEDQDLVDTDQVVSQEVSSISKPPSEGKKRKRDQEQKQEKPVENGPTVGSEKSAKSKKRKSVTDEYDAPAQTEEGEGESGPAKKKRKGVPKEDIKQRFILFVGNLKYTTTREEVEAHFSACDPPPSVRLMAPKPSASGKTTAKSKGFAFVEFGDKIGLQKALRLHHSELDGRRINVELTAGGGGKSESRLSKLKERNKELHEQRKKRLAKTKSGKESDETEPAGDKPSRYSATSGIGHTPTTKRTWTVGDVVEDKKTKKRGSKKRVPRPQGTGVNAIPVG
ncbi:hypothetical protein NLI96_g10670 [Meripilus lineatus]|uniref:RRM domain-containing protein n=1 Tax=Meripilus lineatus TaxID=2056292 RepID=A0AAD5YBR3_9APHY|nr:hypothetical protein NLI96_g10670 [Physisporinus lineatus]